MGTAFALVLLFALFLALVDTLFLDNHDFGFSETFSTSTTSTSSIEVVPSSYWCGDFERFPASQAFPHACGTSLEGHWFTSSYPQSHEEQHYPLEVPSLSSTSQAQCDALPHMSHAVADGDGQELCTWGEAVITARPTRSSRRCESELGRLHSGNFLLPGVSVTSSEKPKSQTEDTEPKRKENATQQGRR
jgi:hypothetical protein